MTRHLVGTPTRRADEPREPLPAQSLGRLKRYPLLRPTTVRIVDAKPCLEEPDTGNLHRIHEASGRVSVRQR